MPITQPRRAFSFRRLAVAALISAVAGSAIAASAADRLPGYVDGAEVIKVDVSRPQIDTISGIIYSQIKSDRAIRQLRMTVMSPRTKENFVVEGSFPEPPHFFPDAVGRRGRFPSFAPSV